MTVIVGAVTKKDGVVLASDSVIEHSIVKTNDYDGKIWSNGEYVLGGAGELRALQVVKYFFNVPEFRALKSESIEEFLVKEVIPPLKEVLREHEVLLTNKKTVYASLNLIIGWDKHVCLIEEDFSIFVPKTKKVATGSGVAQSLGSLDNKSNNKWTKKDVINAVKSAELTAPGVGGSIYTISTKDLKVTKFRG